MKGKQLGQILEKLKLTRKEVADQLNYSPDAIDKWILRNREIPGDCLPLLRRYLRAVIKERREQDQFIEQILFLTQHL